MIIRKFQNINYLKFFSVIIFFLFLLSFGIHSQHEITSTEEFDLSNQCIHLFVDYECPQCQKVLNFINENLSDSELHIYNVSEKENLELYNEFKEKYNLETAGFPIVFIGDNYLLGISEIENYLENELIECELYGCDCPIEQIDGITPGIPDDSDYVGESVEKIDVPFIGKIDASDMPAVLFTSMIAFVDGFNPCSLWVLTFLLGIVLYTGSRKKIALVGITFLTVTATVYGLFIVGLLNVFTYIGYSFWIKLIVGLLAFIFAVVNIKDYFWYKKGISFTIPDKFKPKLFKKMRNIMDPDKSLPSMLIATAVMALGVTLIELPCTSGFPMIWSGFMSDQGIFGVSFYSLLILYILIYLIIELVIFFSAVFTLKSKKFQKKHGRILKLIGGVLMLALAWVLIFRDDLMRTIVGSLYVFGFAFILSFVIMFLHQKILPKFGIKIGSSFDDLEGDKDEG